MTRIAHAMALAAFALMAMALPANAASPQAPTSACGCADEMDLLNRYTEAEAAIAGLQAQIKGMEDKEQKEGAPFLFSLDGYNTMRNRMLDYINSFTIPGTSKAPGKTQGVTCEITNGAQTACLQASTLVHETVHHNACAEGTSLYDYRTTWRMVAVAQEEIASYTTEIRFIQDVLRNLAVNCKRKGWTGVIFYQSLETSVSNRTIPPLPSANILGGTETGSVGETLTAAFTIVDGNAEVTQYFNETATQNQSVTSRLKCSSSLNAPWITNTNNVESVVKYQTQGLNQNATSFGVSNVRTYQYVVNFHAPKSVGTSTKTQSNSPLPCNQPFQQPNPVSISWTQGDWADQGTGTGRTSDPFLSGQEIRTLPGGVTVSVFWVLHH